MTDSDEVREYVDDENGTVIRYHDRRKGLSDKLTPRAVAAVLDKPTAHVWYDIQNRTDKRISRVVYDPSGRVEVKLNLSVDEHGNHAEA